MIKKSILLMVAVSVLTIGAKAQAPHGVVYIESNIGNVSGHNSILAFTRDINGHLAPLGEFPTGGTGVHPNEITFGNLAGTLGPFDSDQNLIFNFDATRIFAVNSGSDTIAVFDVKSNGALVPVKGSPFSSGGTDPVSVGLSASEDTLIVVNKDYDLKRPGFDAKKRSPNYTVLNVKPDGKLDSPSKVDAGKGGTLGPGNTTPTQALVSPKGRLVFDADTFGTTIHSFAIRPNGNLERVASHGTPNTEFVPFPLLANPAGRPFVLGLVAHPREAVFYAGFVFEGKVGVYTYNRAGDFQFVRSAPANTGVCWIATNASGNRIYTSNTLVNTVSVLDTSDPLNPVKIQDFPLAGPPAGPEQLTLDLRGEYLYVVTQKALDIMPPDANALHVLRINPADGTIASQTDRVVIPVSPSIPQGVIAR
jgi:DNA-binding beta-propeller fold protein YncE